VVNLSAVNFGLYSGQEYATTAHCFVPELSMFERLSARGLTQERLKELLEYFPEDGIFMWRESKKGRNMSKPAGGRQRGGRIISIDGEGYQCARLAWLYVHGELPNGYIQFDNGDTSDCRISNLRLGRTRQESNRLFKERHPESNRKANWKSRYNGMTESDYMALYDVQSGVCDVCGQKEVATRGGKVRWLCVDHCHKTGEVRGLLCSACNTAVGYAMDDPSRLRAAADYLDRHAAGRTNIVPLRGKVN
jgi:Recombination endonuclease VII/HNH endonuclease